MGYIYTTRQLNAIEVLIHKLYNWELYIYIFLILDLRMLFEVMGDLKQGGLSKERLGYVAANKM